MSPALLWMILSVIVLLVAVLATGMAILRRLRRLEQRIAEQQLRHDTVESTMAAVETTAGGTFESFLKEDPARRQLSKSEQFAAYRRWRQERGMNWRAP